MNENPIKVTTRQDESNDLTGGLIIVGLILLGCISVAAGIFKLVSLDPNFGIPAGTAFWLFLVVKYEWMRNVVIQAVFIFALMLAVMACLGFFLWAFN